MKAHGFTGTLEEFAQNFIDDESNNLKDSLLILHIYGHALQ